MDVNIRNETSNKVERIMDGLPISPGICLEFSLHCIRRDTNVFSRPSTVATERIKSKLFPEKYHSAPLYYNIIISSP